MSAHRCSRHERGPHDYTKANRCLFCVREAQKRYRTECRDARRQLHQILELLNAG